MFENKKYHFLYLALTIIIVVIQLSCTHDSFLPGNMEPDPMDTMDIDTIPMDTTFVGNPCDTNVIYFQNDILPLLLGSCAFSGCHDAASASDGVILNNYDNVINTADVTPFNLSESKIYKVITENDPDDVMPPTGKLDNEKINLIAQWILQGAKNLECDSEDCDIVDVSYSGFVSEVLSTSCYGCHSTTTAFGGIILDNYAAVLVEVNNGKLFGAINWDIGYERMPQGQGQLDSCTISKIKSWIDDGAQNN